MLSGELNSKAGLLSKFLFSNNYRSAGNCKDSIERVHVPLPQVPPVVTFYIAVVQYQIQDTDIGIRLGAVLRHLICVDSCNQHHNQHTKSFHPHKDVPHPNPV